MIAGIIDVLKAIWEDATFWVFLFSAIPALFYAYVIFLHTPVKKIKLRTALIYIVAGVLSAGIVLQIHELVPGWRNYLFLDYSPPIWDGQDFVQFARPTLMTWFWKAFIQVAFLEEISKWIMFGGINRLRKRFKKNVIDSPVAILYYSMAISMGFAIIENVIYALTSYGPQDTLLIRSFTSVIAHMGFGMVMGYFIAMGRRNTNIEGKTVLQVWLKRHTKYRRVLFTTLGIYFATVIHGLYDFNLFVEHSASINYLWLILGGLLTICYFMVKRLSKLSTGKKNLVN